MRQAETFVLGLKQRDLCTEACEPQGRTCPIRSGFTQQVGQTLRVDSIGFECPRTFHKRVTFNKRPHRLRKLVHDHGTVVLQYALMQHKQRRRLLGQQIPWQISVGAAVCLTVICCAKQRRNRSRRRAGSRSQAAAPTTQQAKTICSSSTS